MKFTAAITIAFAATTLATAVPAANSDAVNTFNPEINARAATFIAARDPKKKKGSSNNDNNNSTNTTDSAATMLSSNVVLELGALGLSVLLWA